MGIWLMATARRGIPIDFRGIRGPKAIPVSTHGASKGLPMVHVGIEFRLSLTYGLDMTKVLGDRSMAKLRREANKQVMQYWHKEIRPKHFTQKGFSEYKYQRRSRATVDIKKKKFGHNDPIVQQGDARAMSSDIKRIRATQHTASLTVNGPWYMGHRAKRKDGQMSPDLKKELSTISYQDAMAMARYGAQMIRKGIAEQRKARRGARKVKP